MTVFESFLKEVHRTILKAVPSLLKHDRQIDLGRLVSKSKDVVVHEEIEREVQTLDRESAKKKAEYFLKRLGINWFDGTIIPILDGVLRLRTEMLHENPDRMVHDTELLSLNLVTTSVPLATLAQTALLYPDAFKLPLHVKKEDAQKFLPR